MNNYSDALCSAEKRNSDKHTKKIGTMFAFLDSYEYPYWHNRGLARVASRFRAGSVEMTPGLMVVPDDNFNFLVLVHNKRHWLATIQHMAEHCLEALFYAVKV